MQDGVLTNTLGYRRSQKHLVVSELLWRALAWIMPRLGIWPDSENPAFVE